MHAQVNALDVRRLCMSYGDYKALNDISISIAPGTLTALIGPNGAGKSSLVKAICGRATIDSGDIAIKGIDTKQNAARENLGVAPQCMALYDHLTAYENLTCFARQANLSRSHAKTQAHKILTMIGMEGAAAMQVRAMSGGMRQRINIGAAIIHDPDLLILDEPIASLDPDGAAQINELIAFLKKQQYGILLITHDMHQAQILSDEVIVLKQGEVTCIGPAQELIQAACGDKVKLILDRACGKDLSANGFSNCASNSYQCVKHLDNRTLIASEITALQNDGVELSSLHIAAPDLNDVLALALSTDEYQDCKQ